MNVPSAFETQIRDASARLGVAPRAVLIGALTHGLELLSEDEAAFCETPELYDAWRQREAARKARIALAS